MNGVKSGSPGVSAQGTALIDCCTVLAILQVFFLFATFETLENKADWGRRNINCLLLLWSPHSTGPCSPTPLIKWSLRPCRLFDVRRDRKLLVLLSKRPTYISNKLKVGILLQIVHLHVTGWVRYGRVLGFRVLRHPQHQPSSCPVCTGGHRKRQPATRTIICGLPRADASIGRRMAGYPGAGTVVRCCQSRTI